jgi:hypothetical protein
LAGDFQRNEATEVSGTGCSLPFGRQRYRVVVIPREAVLAIINAMKRG